jgi:UDP-glucose:(heptosyl)LPS alpha-1,3-glucosyltransferase
MPIFGSCSACCFVCQSSPFPLTPPLHHLTGHGHADLRIAVISPFLDRRHGTERCIVEQLERFANEPNTEIHLYAQRVQDLTSVVRYPASSPGCVIWHRVPGFTTPLLFSYLWWLFANHCHRWWDRNVRGLKFDLLYSPGINALDADAISVHIIFTEFYRRLRASLSLRNAPLNVWAVTLHRRIYYSLIVKLEKNVYPRPHVSLAAISAHTSQRMAEFFARDDVEVIRYGVDIQTFNPSARIQRRDAQRRRFSMEAPAFCLLLIGNDWKNKGLDTLLGALAECSELPFVLLIVGKDDSRAYEDRIHTLRLGSKVRFLGSSPDVMQFFAAADAYVGPSLEDAYGLPVLEAMACGLPVIASSRAGVSEIISHGENGFVLRDPQDALELSGLLREIYGDPALRQKVAEAAARTAESQTWGRNAAATWEFLNAAIARKNRL